MPADPGPPRTVIHVDMDAFYAAIEQRDRPELRGRPVVVGARPGGRGVVAAASYEARRFGVHSAMPIGRAARLCPAAAFLPADRAKYEQVSRHIMRLLAGFTPLLEPVSIDEAFLDVTASGRLWGDGGTIAEAIKARIRSETGLTASVGVATNRFVAKVASDLEKPDGFVVVPPGGEAAFLAPLPVGRIWGVGRVTGHALESLGVSTIGQLQRVPRDTLGARFGAHGEALHDLAWGRDVTPVEPRPPTKSMGAETTFDRDVTDRSSLERVLRAQAERVARELRAAGRAAVRVTLKLRFADFRTVTRSHTGDATQEGLEVYRRAAALLAREKLVKPVRLIGVSAAGLGQEASGQLSLLDHNAVRRDRIARAVDALAARFGDDIVIPASLAVPRARKPPSRQPESRYNSSAPAAD